MKKSTATKKCRRPVTLWLAVGLFLCLSLPSWAQNSTVVIAEVMYDNPLYDNETLAAGKESEFMSLAIIASRPARSTFDIGSFYGIEDFDSSGNIVLYTSTLAYPDTRSRIQIYNAQNQIEDELVYDGLSAALSGEPLLRATNAVNSRRPMSSTVSIQREKITVNGIRHEISRTDYYPSDSVQTIRLFRYFPEEYSETPPPSIFIAPTPDDLELSGTVTENAEYRTTNITSSQVIEGGTTRYMAEDEIYLAPGFEIREGANFEAIVNGDSVHLVTMLTYNTRGKHTHYVKHAEVIRNSKADVAAIQEMRGYNKLNILKENTGLDGDRCLTIADYGIAMLWNPKTVGSPIEKSHKRIYMPVWDDEDGTRAFMVAEFRDFCFVSTHLSLSKKHRKKMVDKILDNKLVKRCLNSGKPVYVAGDMNEEPLGVHASEGKAVKILIENGFEVLNNTDISMDSIHATRPSGSHIDLILEHNGKPNHKTIDRGIPISEEKRKQWMDEDKISDHFPYFVKVKIR